MPKLGENGTIFDNFGQMTEQNVVKNIYMSKACSSAKVRPGTFSKPLSALIYNGTTRLATWRSRVATVATGRTKKH
jgi:hypothetical protein